MSLAFERISMGFFSQKGAKHRHRNRLRAGFEKWVNRRIPPAREITLNQRRIFIFPSRIGLFFSVCLFVMLIAAINFESNLSYGLTFLLMTLFIVAILHTYANLSGLTIRALRATPVFPGQLSDFYLMVERSKKREHFALYFSWPDGSEILVNLVEEDSTRFQLHVPVDKRGWFNPGRLLVESTYPLGLLRCWTWIDLDISALVYPGPIASSELSGLATDTPDGAAMPVPGNDDFYGFRGYRIGDSLRQVYWKGLAKGQGVLTKQYTAYADRSVWLDWEQFPGAGVEQRLSHLCYWALAFEDQSEEYGLRLPGVVIQPASGEKHRDRVLKELALFGFEGTAS
ncbi:DUF58 domain-containing protein [Halioglobus sp.]|nr:DUF58 domain-containing protein [Halioglobus sp.]